LLSAVETLVSIPRSLPRALVLSVYCPPHANTAWLPEELFEDLHFTLFPFGRHAILEALKRSGVRPGDRVLLPGFICRDVLAPLTALSAIPIFYRVDETLQPDEDLDTHPPARAALAVNYFGFAQDLTPFRRYCQKTGATLIEDNAHGLFSRDEEGHQLGTRADFGVFSLRKSVALPNGAVLVVSREKERQGKKAGSVFGESRDDLFFRRKQRIRGLIRRTGVFGARMAVGTSRWLRKIRTGYDLPPPNPKGETTMPLPNTATPLLRSGINTADPEKETLRRRSLYAAVDRLLGGQGEVRPLFQTLPEGMVPYGYPFLCSSDRWPEIQNQLHRKGLLTITWPDLPEAIRASAPAFYHQVRLVPFLW
jgi:hypothetical protein